MMPSAKAVVCSMLLSGAAVMAMPAAVQAQAYPARPVRVVVPFAAGGGTDLMSRIVAEELRKQLGQSFVVENVAGAGGVIDRKSVV